MNSMEANDDKQGLHSKEDANDQELAAYLRRIGARNLASELDDLRFKIRIVDSQRWLDSIDAKLVYEELLNDKYDQRLLANQSFLFDKAQAYNNIISTLGYAGLFGIWGMVKKNMDPWDMKLIAIMLGSSLFLFISWTVYQMILTARLAVNLGEVLGQPFESLKEHLDAIMAQEAKNSRSALRMQKAWLTVFIPTVFLGFGAAGLLLTLLMFDLMGMEFRIHMIPDYISFALSWIVSGVTIFAASMSS